MMTMVGVHAVA